MRVRWCSCALLLALACYGQEKEAPIPHIRVTSALVLVDFVAFDRSGRPVTDLRREEMEISEDGKKQAIESFFPPEPVVAGQAPAAGATRRQRKQAQTVIAIDSRCIDSANFVHSVNAIRRFVESHLAADHALMIVEIYRGLRVLTPMTRDRAALLAALKELKPQAVYNPLDARNANLSSARSYIEELQLQVTYLGDALRSLCHALAGPGGRKHVVFFSEGYPMDPKKLVEMNTQQAVGAVQQSEIRQQASVAVGSLTDPGVLPMIREVTALANGYGISFYTVDARGLIAVPGLGTAMISGDVAAGPSAEAGFSGSPEVGPSEQILGLFQLVAVNRLDDAQNTLTALAGATDGLALYNTNNLGGILHLSALEQETHYVAGYVPPKKKKPGEFHSITVKTSRPGVVIRARMGYVDLPEDQTRTLRLTSALKRPELFRQLSPLVQVEPAPGRIRAVMGLGADQVFFRPKGDKVEGKIVFNGMIYKEDGKPTTKGFAISRGFDMSFPPEQIRGIGNQPLLAQQELDLPRGKYRLVLLAEDRLAGTLGAVVQEFTVP